jgi:hypothetical protein
MAIDLSRKRVIMIHGLAAKPPERDWFDLWKHSVVENIRIDDAPVADALDADPSVFASAYWANAVPHHIEDDARYVKKLRVQVGKVIAERRKVKTKFHVPRPSRIGAFFKSRGLDVVNLLTGALTIKDNVMKGLLAETRLYDEDQYIADRMREKLEQALRDAWDAGCEVAILSHSMGTFIAYDVLWRFSHRRPREFSKYRNKRVRMFVTMGSPLGDGAVRDLLFARHHQAETKRHFPRNIDLWHNYACLGDVVAHQHNFEDEFFDKMRELNLLPDRPKYCAIDYANLHNPFEVVSHQGNRGKEKRNPHKSFGYLVQPRLGTWLRDFLREQLR